MAQYYQVVHGGSTTVTLDDLRHVYPNLQCIDTGNGQIQYIINQDDAGAIQYHQNQQVIGIDQQTGAAVQLGAYPHHQQLVVDNGSHQQGVYVIETIDHTTQAAIEVQQQQVLAAQHQATQFVAQQAVQQQQQQTEQQVQQQQIQQHQQEVFYGRQPTNNGLILDAGVHQEVAGAESPLRNRRTAPQLHQPSQTYQAVKFPNRQVLEPTQSQQQPQSQQTSQPQSPQQPPQQQPSQTQQPQQQSPQAQQPSPQPTQLLNLVQRQVPNNMFVPPEGRKLSLLEWRRMQEQQQLEAAHALKRAENAGVITVTRQNTLQPVRPPNRQTIRQPVRQNARQPIRRNSQQSSNINESVLTTLIQQRQQHQPQDQQQPQQLLQEQQQQQEQQQFQEQQQQQLLTPAVQRQIQFTNRRQVAASKARLRTHNTLVTNNTVQAIASPTGENHQTLLQQHDNVISVVDQLNPVQQRVVVEEPQEEQKETQNTTQVLLLLPSGEQRLIKFDAPHADASIRELLGRVGINLDSNVSVLNCANMPEVAQEAVVSQSDEHMVIKQEPMENQTQEGSVLVSGHVVATQVAISSTQQDLPVIKIEEPQEQKPEIKEIPRYVEGMVALCPNCGYSSINFSRCLRCKRILPESVKSFPVLDTAKKKPPAPVAKEKLYSKLPVKIDGSTEGGKCTKRGRQPSRKNRKLVEEPVILTLSSDEDDNGRQSDLDSALSDRSLSGSQSLPGDSTTYIATDPAVTSSAMGKEPIIPEEEDAASSDAGEIQHSQGVKGGGREMDFEAFIDGSMQGSYTLLQCRTVRIGSYKVVPRERIILSTIGIRISVPSIEDEEKNIILTIDTSEIVKVLIHFGRGMPVLFFYTVAASGARIRNLLKMESKTGPYYDPTSTDETQRRITLLPEKLNEDSKVALKNIFGNLNVLGELNNKEANDILVRASPKEVQNMMKKAIGMSPTKGNNEIQTIMVYPPPPAKGGIPINTEDYACLGEDQFLNDVIIDFYLKYLTLSVLSELDQARTHVFSSFFYKRLTTRPVKSARRSHPIEDDPKLSPAEKRHSRVKSWTKNVNLFEKDFVIIPINEHCHWFLAIICFPGLTGCVRISDNSPVTEPVKKLKKTNHKKTPESEIMTKAIHIGSTTITPVKIVTDTITLETGEEGSDRDEAEGDDEDMDGTSEEEDNGYQPSQPGSPVKHEIFSELTQEPLPKTDTKNKAIKLVREPIRQPCILIFDSLAGASRTRVVATLRDYLRIEYKVKEGKERDFSKDTIKGASPKVPQQTNFTDCGLYLLQYVESFFQEPVKDYHLPMRILANWFTEDVVNRKREDLQKLLLSLMEQNNVDIESLNLPKLTFPSTKQESTNSVQSGSGNEETTENSTQVETVEGGLVFTCTEEEYDGAAEEEEETPVHSLNSSDVSGTTDDICSTQETNSERRSLVNYSDSESNSSMAVDSEVPVTLSTDSKKGSAMFYLKSKRIERHLSKDIDKKPAKKMKADNSVPRSSYR